MNDKKNKNRILVGNSFPFSLIRAVVTVTPVEIEHFRNIVAKAEIHSYWGHNSTIVAANQLLQIDVTPESERPALHLSQFNRPILNGYEFIECWILSPNFIENFRPRIGEEVLPEKIKSWHVLNIRWK